MTGRRLLLGAMLALLATPAAAQQQASVQPQVAAQPATTAQPHPNAQRQAGAPEVRRPAPRRRAAPPAAPPPPVDTRRGDPAPVPNLDMEGPRRVEASRAAPRLDPALIDPAEPRFGTATDRNNLQAREDRLLRQPAAGARLRLPFTY